MRSRILRVFLFSLCYVLNRHQRSSPTILSATMGENLIVVLLLRRVQNDSLIPLARKQQFVFSRPPARKDQIVFSRPLTGKGETAYS